MGEVGEMRADDGYRRGADLDLRQDGERRSAESRRSRASCTISTPRTGRRDNKAIPQVPARAVPRAPTAVPAQSPGVTHPQRAVLM